MSPRQLYGSSYIRSEVARCLLTVAYGGKPVRLEDSHSKCAVRQRHYRATSLATDLPPADSPAKRRMRALAESLKTFCIVPTSFDRESFLALMS